MAMLEHHRNTYQIHLDPRDAFAAYLSEPYNFDYRPSAIVNQYETTVLKLGIARPINDTLILLVPCPRFPPSGNELRSLIVVGQFYIDVRVEIWVRALPPLCRDMGIGYALSVLDLVEK